jgi:uncharacterized Fe-S cluster protein YjdI
MPRKDYTAPGIVVHWDGDRCIHSTHCVSSLPGVFDTSARPWSDAHGADADTIAAAVDGCPSRALTYSRTDGAAPGPGARRGEEDRPEEGAAAVTINVKPAGPLAVMGSCAVVDGDGNVLEAGERIFLCRCGGSERKPFCDGTHKRVGFTG